MAKLGSLPHDLQRKYEWQCLSCNLVFRNQAAGLKCTKCGGKLQKVNPKMIPEKTIGD